MIRKQNLKYWIWPLQTTITPSISTGPTLGLSFVYRDGMYNLDREYYVYDTSHFLADIGGYLGLLLGHSLLSIYSMSTKWILGLGNTIKNLVMPNK